MVWLYILIVVVVIVAIVLIAVFTKRSVLGERSIDKSWQESMFLANLLFTIYSLHIKIITLIKGTAKGADISILIVNLVTLGLSYLVQYAVYGSEVGGVAIGLLLTRIVVVAVIVFAIIGIVNANSGKKIEKIEKEETPQIED